MQRIANPDLKALRDKIAASKLDNYANYEYNAIHFDQMNEFYSAFSRLPAKKVGFSVNDYSVYDLAKAIGFDLMQEVQKLKNNNTFTQQNFEEVAKKIKKQRGEYYGKLNEIHRKLQEIDDNIDEKQSEISTTSQILTSFTEKYNKDFDLSKNAAKEIGKENQWVDCSENTGYACNEHWLCKRVEDEKTGWSGYGYYKAVPRYKPDPEEQQKAQARLADTTKLRDEYSKKVTLLTKEKTSLDAGKGRLVGQRQRLIAEHKSNEEKKFEETLAGIILIENPSTTIKKGKLMDDRSNGIAFFQPEKRKVFALPVEGSFEPHNVL